MTDFDQVVERRKLLKGAFALGATAFVASAVPFGRNVFAHGGIEALCTGFAAERAI